MQQGNTKENSAKTNRNADFVILVSDLCTRGRWLPGSTLLQLEVIGANNGVGVIDSKRADVCHGFDLLGPIWAVSSEAIQSANAR